MTKHLKATGQLFLKAGKKWDEDNVVLMSAALAYNMLFSFMPLLIIIIAIAGSVFGESAVQGELQSQIQRWVGEKAARVIQVILENTEEHGSGLLTTIFSGVIFLFGASNVFMQLQSTLNDIWKIEFNYKNWLVTHLLQRGIAIIIIASIGFLMALSFILDTLMAAFGGYVLDFFSNEIYFYLINAGNFLLSFLIVTGLFATIYRTVPRAAITWKDVWSGALVAAFLFKIGNTLITIYVAKSMVVSAFGAAGSVIAILFWFYFVAHVLFFGAEITYAYAQEYGSQAKK